MLMSVLCVSDITLQWLIQHSRTRRSWGGGAGVWLEEPHHVINYFRRSWFHSKQTSIRPSFYSYKLIHIIYIVYFCFYLNVLFYGSSWSLDVSHDAFCVFLLGDLIKPQPTPTAFVRTSALWSRDSRRSILRCHLVLTFFQRSTCSLNIHWENSPILTVLASLAC